MLRMRQGFMLVGTLWCHAGVMHVRAKFPNKGLLYRLRIGILELIILLVEHYNTIVVQHVQSHGRKFAVYSNLRDKFYGYLVYIPHII